MCGIAGIVALGAAAAGPSREQLVRMAAALRHRGPDAAGIYRGPRAGLAHARLSIIDLEGGAQPMSNQGGSQWIVFNGEIFNYVELRRDLEREGWTFRTRSDTEVLLRAWEAWGEGAFERMNGQWAVAIWNGVAQSLLLARDRLGVRPLFLCEHRGRLYFASEVKALFAADDSLPRALDPAGLDQVLTFWGPVAPQSVFAGVRELEPGHLCIASGGSIRRRPYWSPRYPISREEQFAGTADEAADATTEALDRATRLRVLRSDVPVGAYLSGGLDSSLIAAMAAGARGGRLATFSIRFEDAEYDEQPFQRVMARHLGSEHHEVVVRRADIAAVFPEVVFHAECPLVRTAPAPLFLLSRLVHEAGIKVVLTGEGADEMFAGYDLFREAKIRRFWARQPASVLRPLLLRKLYPYMARSPVAVGGLARQFFGQNLAGWRAPGFGHGPRWQSGRALRRLLSRDVLDAVGRHDPVAALLGTLPREFGRWSFLAQDQYLETRTLLAGYILSSQGDRMLMAHSVEGRFPFLDKDVVSLAQSLPAEFKLRVLDEKHVLKRIGRGRLPASILERTKQPYRAPDAASFLGAGAPAWFPDVLSDAAISDAGLFDLGAIRQLREKCRARNGGPPLSQADNMALVAVASTQLLHDRFVRQPSAIPGDGRVETCADEVERATA